MLFGPLISLTDVGSFDSVRLAPHSAPDDRKVWFLPSSHMLGQLEIHPLCRCSKLSESSLRILARIFHHGYRDIETPHDIRAHPSAQNALGCRTHPHVFLRASVVQPAFPMLVSPDPCPIKRSTPKLRWRC